MAMAALALAPTPSSAQVAPTFSLREVPVSAGMPQATVSQLSAIRPWGALMETISDQGLVGKTLANIEIVDGYVVVVDPKGWEEDRPTAGFDFLGRAALLEYGPVNGWWGVVKVNLPPQRMRRDGMVVLLIGQSSVVLSPASPVLSHLKRLASLTPREAAHALGHPAVTVPPTTFERKRPGISADDTWDALDREPSIQLAHTLFGRSAVRQYLQPLDLRDAAFSALDDEVLLRPTTSADSSDIQLGLVGQTQNYIHELGHRLISRMPAGQMDTIWSRHRIPRVPNAAVYGHADREEHQVEALAYAVRVLSHARTLPAAQRAQQDAVLDEIEHRIPGTKLMAALALSHPSQAREMSPRGLTGRTAVEDAIAWNQLPVQPRRFRQSSAVSVDMPTPATPAAQVRAR